MNRGSKVLTVLNFVVALASLCAVIFYVYLFVGCLNARAAEPGVGAGIAEGFSIVFMIIMLAVIVSASVIGIILFLISKFSSGRLVPLWVSGFLGYHIFIVLGSALLFFIAVFG